MVRQLNICIHGQYAFILLIFMLLSSLAGCSQVEQPRPYGVGFGKVPQISITRQVPNGEISTAGYWDDHGVNFYIGNDRWGQYKVVKFSNNDASAVLQHETSYYRLDWEIYGDSLYYCITGNELTADAASRLPAPGEGSVRSKTGCDGSPWSVLKEGLGIAGWWQLSDPIQKVGISHNNVGRFRVVKYDNNISRAVVSAENFNAKIFFGRAIWFHRNNDKNSIYLCYDVSSLKQDNESEKEAIERVFNAPITVNPGSLEAGCSDGAWLSFTKYFFTSSRSWKDSKGRSGEVSLNSFFGDSIVALDTLSEYFITKNSKGKYSKIKYQIGDKDSVGLYCVVNEDEDTFVDAKYKEIDSITDNTELGCKGKQWVKLYLSDDPKEETGPWQKLGSPLVGLVDVWGMTAFGHQVKLINQDKQFYVYQGDNGKYNRDKYFIDNKGDAYVCEEVSDSLTYEEALSHAHSADVNNLATGCNGGPWVRFVKGNQIMGSFIESTSSWDIDSTRIRYNNSDMSIEEFMSPFSLLLNRQGSIYNFYFISTLSAQNKIAYCMSVSGKATVAAAKAFPFNVERQKTKGCNGRTWNFLEGNGAIGFWENPLNKLLVTYVTWGNETIVGFTNDAANKGTVITYLGYGNNKGYGRYRWLINSEGPSLVSLYYCKEVVGKGSAAEAVADPEKANVSSFDSGCRGGKWERVSSRL